MVLDCNHPSTSDLSILLHRTERYDRPKVMLSLSQSKEVTEDVASMDRTKEDPKFAVQIG
jgi:hypothetical protein